MDQKQETLSFENTEIAFSNCSNFDLRRAYYLFCLVKHSILVFVGEHLINFAFRSRLPISSIIKHTIYRQFVGGENINECNKVIKKLGTQNIGTILDYSSEGHDYETYFMRCFTELKKVIEYAKSDDNIPFCVFKVTGLARFSLLEKQSLEGPLEKEDSIEWNVALKRIEELCIDSEKNGKPILIDAEETWIQQAIDNIAMEMMSKFNKQKTIVFNTYQLYRIDKFESLKKDLDYAKKHGFKLGVKLVRGAYLEKERIRAVKNAYPSPIYETKKDTDQAYNDALKFCVQNIDSISLCAGTHNEESSIILIELLNTFKIDSNDNRITFSQLYGMGDHISYNLANAGYRVAKYVPFGPVAEVVPYLLRRAKENSSVKGQTGRELGLIIREIKRRRQKNT